MTIVPAAAIASIERFLKQIKWVIKCSQFPTSQTFSRPTRLCVYSLRLILFPARVHPSEVSHVPFPISTPSALPVRRQRLTRDWRQRAPLSPEAASNHGSRI